MLRASDLLLTLAAVFLLNAALRSSAKSNRFTQASANQVMQSQSSDTERELYASHPRPSDQMQSVDHWMSKIRRNLKRSERENQRTTLPNNGSSPDQQHEDAQQVSQYRPALEVKLDFLRTNSAPSESANSPRGARNTSSSSTNTLYLLNYLLPHLKTSRTDEATLALPEVNSNELFDSSEQQQPPPFTLFPPMQQSVGPIPNQIQQQPAIRQMLSNYQRYPQSRPLSDHQRQLHTQLQPRPPELHLRPPTQAPALGLGNQNTQQPLSPLQLLAGPFQAFLPGLANHQQQTPGQNSHTQQQQQQSAKAILDVRGDNGLGSPVKSPAPQQPNPFGAFLNPFNFQPPASAVNANGAQQQPVGGEPGISNLQSFYQQLPLYQALMAARQRQEALQAAQKMREQQQTKGHHLNNQPLGASQPAPTPNGENNDATPPPFARLPPGAFGLPAQTLPNPSQPPANPFAQTPWTPQLQPQQPAPPYSQQPVQLNLNQPPQTPVGQPVNSIGNHNGPVQFDDDQPVSQGPQKPISQQPAQQPPTQENPHQEEDSGRNNSESENDNDHKQNDANQGDDNQNNGNNQDSAGQEQDNQSGRPAEEEDPDLKSFQNLADGGDSFTDLFPKGILSDGDINEIKTQQAEQAKKQEEQERQRHLRQQQQQQQQQYNNQPMNQLAGNNIDNGNYQNTQQPIPNQQQDHNDNNQGAPNQGGENEERNEQQDDANRDDGEGGGEGDGEGDSQEEDSPTAAALTTKSASNEQFNGRWTKSPGVEYARM